MLSLLIVMTKNGVYVLKKHNRINSYFLFFLLAVILFLAAGCKSVPAAREVNAIELLDDKSAFYIALPSSADTKLIERIIKNNVPGISDSNVKLICEKINKVYCGINRSKNQMEFQSVLEGNIPVNMMSKVLSKKNGWTSKSVKSGENQLEYKLYNISNDKINLDMAFPSNKIACIGRNVQDMIVRYDTLVNLPVENNQLDTLIDEELTEYLTDSDNEIRFFANKPQSFLTILTGVKLDLKLKSVKGAFIQDVDHENQYILNLHFDFLNEKFLKAGKTLLTLAFGLTNSQSIVIGTDILEINGIKLDKEQLYKLLVL